MTKNNLPVRGRTQTGNGANLGFEIQKWVLRTGSNLASKGIWRSMDMGSDWLVITLGEFLTFQRGVDRPTESILFQIHPGVAYLSVSAGI